MEQENQSPLSHHREEAIHDPTMENAVPAPAVDNLVVIGIGASAGGLSALRTFFSALPHDTGMTFVVVVHLSPEHESVLAELLQGYTLMPVRQVQAQIKMEPNHVYVIPPAKRLIVADGHVDLADFDMPRGPRLQIDTFFRSLAEQHGDGAAIILSGTGSDGAVGIQSIKEEGGLIFVQSPDEAEYDGMPKSAIATGLVDIVAPVAELAKQLVAAKRTRAVLQLPSNPNDLSTPAQQTLTQILAQLHVRTGHDFRGYKQATLLRRIARRMQLVQKDTLSGYLNHIRHDGDEVEALFRDLLIHVTEFFRDAAAWQYLQDEIIPQIFANKGAEDNVRVWTVGCATGEEAYGLAILLAEYATTLEKPPSMQVFASDLGRLVLDFAREGVYPEAIAADVSEERLNRFFIKDNSHYRVRPEVREMVLFAPHNLLQDPPFSKLDLILCRNLLIYLQRPAQTRVFDAFYYALRPDGYLFLGSAEATDGATEHFETANKQHRIYQRSKRQLETLVLPALPLLPHRFNAPLVETSPAAELSAGTSSVEGEQHRLMLEEVSLPSLLIDEHYQVLHLSETVGRYLQLPPGTLTNDLVRLVRPELQTELRLALVRAFSLQHDVHTLPIPVQFNGTPHPVTILVRPIPRRRRALVLFWENTEPAPEITSPDESVESSERETQFEAQLHYSQQQLQSTREEYETSVEELRAANEELQSTNEEYRSTLEELETSKEELQSINEELQSVNQEMKVRIDEIAQANSDLQNLFAATEIATLFLDRDLCVKRYTPRSAELFNLMPPDRGRPISHMRSQLKYPTLEAEARQVLSSLVPIEHEVQAEDGRWFKVGVRPYRTVEDKIDGVVITCVDITTIKANELALREANAQFSKANALFASLFHANPIPTALTRLEDGLLLDANTAYLRFFELDRELVLGKSIDHLGHWLPQEARDELVARVRRGEQVRTIELAIQSVAGQTKTALVSIERVEADGVECAISTFVDITERKRTEAALAASEERYRTLFESMDEGFCVIEVLFDDAQRPIDYRFLEVNPAFERQTELEQVVGKRMRALVPTHEEHWFETYGKVATTGEPVRFVDEAAGLHRWYDVFALRIGLPQEHQVAVIFKDITERIQSEEALVQANEQLEARVMERTEQVSNLVLELTMSEQEERRRISSILHDDLQQRLFSLLFQLYTVRDALEIEPDAARATINEIEEALQNSVQITRQLSVDLSPPVLHDEGLVEALRWLANRMQQQHGLQVDVRAEAGLPIPNEDLRVLLFQIVRELLFNVVKHAGVNEAQIVLAHIDGRVRIEVSDAGHGFAQDEQREPRQNSQGLQRIEQRLNLLDGRMEIESAPGQGTRITLYSPLQGRAGSQV